MSAFRISRSYEEVAEAIRQGHPQAPAAKWLVENYTFIEEQIDQVRLIFPPGYSRQFPRPSSGPLKGFPRIYEMAIELVSHTDGRVDAENISHFIRSYQTVHPLKLGELWAVPIMVSLALVENLRRVSRRIVWRGMAHQEGETTFFRIKISWRGRTTTTALNERANARVFRPHVAA